MIILLYYATIAQQNKQGQAEDADGGVRRAVGWVPRRCVCDSTHHSRNCMFPFKNENIDDEKDADDAASTLERVEAVVAADEGCVVPDIAAPTEAANAAAVASGLSSLACTCASELEGENNGEDGGEEAERTDDA